MRVATKTTDIYLKSLKLMPKNFTSHYFTKTLREFGVSNYEIENDYYYEFLKNECVKVKRMHWQKKPACHLVTNVEPTNVTPTVEHKKIEVSTTLTDSEMIELLKLRGYKVLKQTWKQL